MSRRGIETASMTLHAAGAPHGPQPGAVEASLGKTATDELGVAIDCFDPLRVAETATALKTRITTGAGSRSQRLLSAEFAGRGYRGATTAP